MDSCFDFSGLDLVSVADHSEVPHRMNYLGAEANYRGDDRLEGVVRGLA
jgi:hypothetical protein